MNPTGPAAHRGNHSAPVPDADDEDLEADHTDHADHSDIVGRLAAVRDRADRPGPLDELLAGVAQRAEAEGLLDVAWTTTDSPVGRLTLAATPVGLIRVAFGTDDDILEELAEKISPRVLEAPTRLDDTRRQLDEYFAGHRHRFDLPLDWGLSRGFRQEALRKLVEVPYGQVVSYKELATRAGSPNAVRATGTAMATNPIPLVVPCHRVVRSGGALGQYGGGVDAKVWLLELEGAPVGRR